MLKAFKHLAKCNEVINGRMIGVIEGSGEEVFDRPHGAYFKSAGEILDHIYVADLFWLHTIRAAKTFPALSDKALAALPARGERTLRSLSECKEKRTQLDEAILGLVGQLEETDLSMAVVVCTPKGEKKECPLWKVLVQVFEHQTHHRGQISLVLDEMKIENDYSVTIGIE
jgi:uncharacterized damage-inducible protein DinB